MKLLTRVTTLVVLALTVNSPALDQSAADNVADYCLGALGRSGGVAALPRSADGTLARSILAKSGMSVHVACAQLSQVPAIRAVAQTAPRHTARLYVGTGSASQLQYATNFVDLLVITGLADGDLSGVSRDEIIRVLGPGGMAFVGRATQEGAGLSASALQAWAGGRSEVAVQTNSQGTWAVVTKPRLRGSDEWTHYMHAPDNNPASNDSLVKWPYLPQWRQRPVGAHRWGAAVMAGGRSYTLRNGWNGDMALTAFRTANGSLLWYKRIADAHPGMDPSPMVAFASGLYLASANGVQELDGETGNVRRTIVIETSTSRRVKWIAVDGGTLFAFTGDNSDDPANRHPGNALFAYNLSNGSRIWSKTYPGTINGRDIGMASGKLFVYVQNSGALCVSAADGSTVWTQNSAAVVSALQADGCIDWCDLSSPLASMLCSPYTLYIRSTEDEVIIALRVSDGSVLWSSPVQDYGRYLSSLIQGSTLIAPVATDATKRYVNVQTNTSVSGTPQTSLQFGSDGCGVRSSTPDGYFGNGGGQACSFSLNKNLGHSNIKTDCGIGTLFADGIMLLPTTGCFCYPTRGNLATASAGGFVFNQNAVQSERLVNGPAAGNITTQVVPDAQDWHTYRANQNRNGASSVAIPTGLHLKWTYTPAHPYDTTSNGTRTDETPTAPVTAGQYVFWAGTDGYVRCIDNTQGREIWSYATGGAINAAPTVFDGCVYVGSEDGHAYCIEAHTGRLVWRFRGAPAARLFNMYGHLSSTWPVNSGVAIVNGNAVFAAGMMDEYGTHVYALDAKTGAIRWQNNTSGSALNTEFNSGFTPSGFITVAGDKIYVKSIEGRNGIFNAASGAFEPIPSSPGQVSNYGREMMMLDDNHVMYGGRLLYADFNDLAYNSRKRTYSVMALDAQKKPLYPEVTVIMNSNTAPAWDSQDMFVWLQDGGWGTSWMEKWSTAAYIRKVDDTRAANAGKGDVALDGFPTPASQPYSTSMCASWIRPYDEIRAMALAPNAICLVGAMDGVRDNPSGKQYIGVYRRDRPDSLYRALLPGTVASSAIAINRIGDIILTLHDGKVVCYGSGNVSVAAHTPAQTAPSSVESTVDSRSFAMAPSAAPHGQTSQGPAQLPSDAPAVASPSARTQSVGSLELRPVASVVQPAVTCYATQATARQIPVAIVAERPSRRSDAPGLSSGLEITSVRASSSARGNVPANVADRSVRTRWAPAQGGTQWLELDLGANEMIASLALQWYARSDARQGINVKVSLDGVTFVNAYAGELLGRGSRVTGVSFAAVHARYVRIECHGIDPRQAVSIVEAAVYNEPSLARARVR